MSTAQKLVEKILGGISSSAYTEKNADIQLTKKQLVKWARGYNRSILESGMTTGLIPLYGADGRLNTDSILDAFGKYTSVYVRNRQPYVLARSKEAGITLVDEDYSFLRIKTKTKSDPLIPKVGRVDKNTEIDDSLIGTRDFVSPAEVRGDF